MRCFIFKEGEFEWDEQLQSLISGAFFWGYIITQPLGGRAAEKIGTRRLMAVAQSAVGIITVVLPFMARLGVEFFIIGRILLGISQVMDSQVALNNLVLI